MTRYTGFNFTGDSLLEDTFSGDPRIGNYNLSCLHLVFLRNSSLLHRSFSNLVLVVLNTIPTIGINDF